MRFHRILDPTFLTLPAIAMMLFVASCGGGGKKNDKKKSEFEKMSKSDSAKDSRVVNVGGKLFSVPSPIQTAFLIEKSGAKFNESLLNDPSNVSRYPTKFEKAINLGIYGADLGYVTIYDNQQKSFKYLTSIRKLARDIGVESAFDKTLVKRFKDNVGDQDSMLALVSDAYKMGDAYLKKNDRSDVAGLILAGGWIESLFFATKVAQKGNKMVKERVAMQKTSLKNLIKLLGKKRHKEKVNDLVEGLEELYGVYEEIEMTYQYKEPKTKPKEKLTVLKSDTKVKISKKQMKSIRKQIKEIRNQITGQ
ncbi:MAG: hypothetical protein ABEH38_01255 [Flavobacteriales bacterium]